MSVKLSRIEQAVEELITRHTAVPVVVAPAQKAVAPLANQGATTICTCNGDDRNGCLCLKAGAKCHCTPGVGSVWQKTAHKASTTSSPPPARSAPDADGGIPVRRAGHMLYWTVNGVEWSNLGNPPHEGIEYAGGGRKFTFRGGRIFDTTNTVAGPALSGGHYERRCDGKSCWMEWVND